MAVILNMGLKRYCCRVVQVSPNLCFSSPQLPGRHVVEKGCEDKTGGRQGDAELDGGSWEVSLCRQPFLPVGCSQRRARAAVTMKSGRHCDPLVVGGPPGVMQL